MKANSKRGGKVGDNIKSPIQIADLQKLKADKHREHLAEILRFLEDDDAWSLDPINRLFTCHAKLHELDREFVDDYSREEVNSVASVGDLQNLKKWINDNTAETGNSLAMHTASMWSFFVHPNEFMGIGVKSTTEIKGGDAAIMIPRSVMLSSKFGKGRAKPIVPLLNGLEDNSVLQMVACVMYQKLLGERSWFYPYLKCLPKIFNVPLFWSRSIFEAIDGTVTLKRCVYSVRASMVLYIRLLQDIRSLNISEMSIYKASWKSFSWALGVVITRQNNAPLRPEDWARLSREIGCKPNLEEMAFALIPGWDMMNHEV